MFKSRRDPRIGDFIRIILIKEPEKFKSFQEIYIFLKELYPVFKTNFFDEDYLEALVPEPESESEPEDEEDDEDEGSDNNSNNKFQTVGELGEENLNMTGQKSNKEMGGLPLKAPSFGNLDTKVDDVKSPNIDKLENKPV
jgi:hypothetical protein